MTLSSESAATGVEGRRVDPLATFGRRLSFGVSQATRVAWYTGQSALMRRVMARIEAGQERRRTPLRRPSTPIPQAGRLLRDVGALLARDLANIEAGLYPMPADDDHFPARLAASRALFADLPEVARRRRDAVHQEPFEESSGRRPRYYLQNFHFQTGGWMTEESAQLYDTQVEVLFNGSANAMRRQALVPLARAIFGRDQRRLAYADIACGTGAFLTDVARAFPRLPTLAVDMSPAYLQHARQRHGRRAVLRYVCANAEALPLPDGALDMSTCIYLFHELPAKVRRTVAQEAARVVKPGGLFVLVDSLQTGDEPDYDGLLEMFPQMFHEPYFEAYLTEDLDALFDDAGFTRESVTTAFTSKIVSFRRR